MSRLTQIPENPAAHPDDPAVLLRRYAKRTKKADTTTADIIGTLTRGFL